MFEHKLFLTATPHNGHTRSFSGLLEILDPVRFTQTSELTDEEKNRIQQVLVRRLKSEINSLDKQHRPPKPFSAPSPRFPALFLTREERALSAAVEEFRKAVKSKIGFRAEVRATRGQFRHRNPVQAPAVLYFHVRRVLGQVLRGADAEFADSSAVKAAQRSLDEDLDDDRELESRAHHAAQTVGAWLKPFFPISGPKSDIDLALERLGLTRHGDQGADSECSTRNLTAFWKSSSSTCANGERETEEGAR